MRDWAARAGKMVATVLTLGLAAAVLFPVFAMGHRPSLRLYCISNLKQMGIALWMYEDENSGLLPDRDRWQDLLQPYTKFDDIYRCPHLVKGNHMAYGYALNSWLQGRNMEALPSPEKTPRIYDSLNLSRNASDPFLSLPPPVGQLESMRRNVGFADGHAKFVMPATPAWRAP